MTFEEHLRDWFRANPDEARRLLKFFADQMEPETIAGPQPLPELPKGGGGGREDEKAEMAYAGMVYKP